MLLLNLPPRCPATTLGVVRLTAGPAALYAAPTTAVSAAVAPAARGMGARGPAARPSTALAAAGQVRHWTIKMMSNPLPKQVTRVLNRTRVQISDLRLLYYSTSGYPLPLPLSSP
jgi:hypothetical protein